jgi:hypothetical protein
MASLASQTNINTTRYFFATTEAGEQVLNTETQAAGNLTDFYVSISGPQGNAVQINQMPDIIGTVTTGGEEMVYAGTASTYKTLSSLSATATGISLSTDRIPGSGIASIESYASNGPFTGFEFLTRGTNSALLSTTTAGINTYMSTIGRPGATAVLGGTGTLVCGSATGASFNSVNTPDNGGAGIGVFTINDMSGVGGVASQARWSWYKYGPQTDLALASYSDAGNFIAPVITASRSNAVIQTINQYAYPQKLLSTLGVANQTGVSVPPSSPTVIYTLSNANLLPNAIYLADVAFQWQVGTPGATGTWIELGLRMGSNGGFNYDVPQYIPPGGTGPLFISNSVGQITDCGTVNQNIDVIAYHNNATAISVSTNTITGGAMNYFKQIT